MPYFRQEEITEKQAEVFTYMVEHVQEYGYQPSMTEMAEHFGVTVKAIRDRLMQLAGKGYVELPPKHSDRCIRLKHVRFVATFADGDPLPPDDTPEAHPVSGPILRERVVDLLRNNKNSPTSVAEIARSLGTPRQHVYDAIKHDPNGVFVRVQGSRGQLWKLAKT
jgi:predicted DNA-binding protein YlxM (UPF0122 family)